jgi:hypothetical protein
MKNNFHTTKDGKRIKISDMETSHLENMVRFIEAKAKNGFVVTNGGGSCAEDIWMDVETYYGKDVKKMLNYKSYKEELDKRNKKFSPKE